MVLKPVPKLLLLDAVTPQPEPRFTELSQFNVWSVPSAFEPAMVQFGELAMLA